MLGKDSPLRKQFGEAIYGINWALKQIPGIEKSGKDLMLAGKTLFLKQNGKLKGDNYEIKTVSHSIQIQSGTATGMIGAALALARQVDQGKLKNKSQSLKFKTRFYKHEVRWESISKKQVRGRHSDDERALSKYSDVFMEAFFQALAQRHFNAFVIYAGYHPFESFLDYKGFEQATNKKTAAIRKRNFDVLTRLLTWAKRYGMRTFLHHYVSHFTQELSDHLKLGLDEGGVRLASYNHPEVNRYNCYIYERTLKVLPSLDGYFLNFESAGNTGDFLKNVLLKTLNKLKKKPPLYFRLWGISDTKMMRYIIGNYKGTSGFIHKGHDTNDIYYYPVPDDRVKVWKKALPKTEFTFSIGPCHNCATNLSSKLWTDEEYINTYLKSAEAKGTDSISFQASFDLLVSTLPDNQVFGKDMIEHSRMNIGHLESYIAYVRGEKVNLKEVYAKAFNTNAKNAALLEKTIIEISKMIMKRHQQFCYGSPAEGYLFPGRFSHYQEPFFYYPMSFHNRLSEVKPNLCWRPWVVRDTKIKVVPNDTQAPIDFVNPAIKKNPPRNPGVMIKEFKSHLQQTKKNLAALKKSLGKKLPPFFVERCENNMIASEWTLKEIQIAIELYSCYFTTSKKDFFGHLKKVHAHLKECTKLFGKKIKLLQEYKPTTFCGFYNPVYDEECVAALLPFEKENYSLAGLQAYLKSHERYNEIRRLSRPYVGVHGKMAERNRGLLKESLSYAEKSLAILKKQGQLLYYDNVQAWAEYVRAEIDWLTPPTMLCRDDKELEKNEGFRDMIHDQNYRWGEHCWEDFSSFFRRQDFFREEKSDCRATATKDGLKLSLREHGIDWQQRKAMWDKNRGTVNQTGFMRIFLNPGNLETEDLIQYIIYFEGCGGTVSGRWHGEKPKQISNCRVHFEHTDSNWRFDITIPWKQLGGRPKKGAEWGLNILSNAPVLRNHQVAWCQGYEFSGNDSGRLGNLVF